MRGDRSRQSAKKLWASLPGVYRQCAVAYTDFWESYKTVIPSKRHRPVGKETGQTNPIERLNNTFRQRISRLVRESLSFSKKMENHVGEPFGILSMTTMHTWQRIKPPSLLSNHHQEAHRCSHRTISPELRHHQHPEGLYTRYISKSSA
jgi:insertion element IS1 protein InsB